MKTLEKIMAVSAILGFGLLIVDFFLCIIGLVTCSNNGLGTTIVFQNLVSGMLIGGIFLCIFAALLTIVYAIVKFLENR